MGLLTDPGKNDKFAKLLTAHYAKLSVLAFTIGLGWLLGLVTDELNLKSHFSENALLPGLVQAEFSSADESFASLQYRQLIDLAKNDKEDVRLAIKKGFQDIGLEVYDHLYNYSTPRYPGKVLSGHGIYAIIRAPRANGLESVVISAPFRKANTKLGRTEGGIALMLALAQHFRYKNYWAKDIIFVVTDNEHFGVKAWVETYHGIKSHSIGGFDSPLRGRAGSIQAAINLEIPSSNVDYLDLRLVGINGQMPNLDLVSLVRLLVTQQQIPITIQGSFRLLERAPGDFFGKYCRDFDTVFRMIKASASGDLEGNHGFFQQYNIQAISIRGMKNLNTGNNLGRVGFQRLGVALEGICRSLNNLLERFHQSYFFYLLTQPNRFISIAMYMAPFGILIVPLVLKALALWAHGTVHSASGVATSTTTVGEVLPWILLAHGIGIALFIGQYFIDVSNVAKFPVTILAGISVAIFILPTFVSRFITSYDAQCIKSLSLIEMAIGLYALSMLNFPLAMLIAVFSVPVAVWSSNEQSPALRAVHGLLLFVMYPISAIVVCNVWDKLSTIYDAEVANEVVKTGTRSILMAMLQYFEYGNWLDPVTLLFLVPLWVLHWIFFWVK